MMCHVFFMILGLILPPLAVSECPDIEDEPVMYPYDEELFLCADVYQGHGDYDAIQACNICEEDGFYQFYADNGRENPGEVSQYFPMGSIVIMPGCTFYGFADINYEGEVRQYAGGQVIPYVEELDEY